MPTKDELVTALSDAMNERTKADLAVEQARASLVQCREVRDQAAAVERDAQKALHEHFDAAEREKGSKPDVSLEPEI